MVKFAEGQSRMYKNIFVCRSCKNKIRAPSSKILSGRIHCRKCGAKALRAVRKK